MNQELVLVASIFFVLVFGLSFFPFLFHKKPKWLDYFSTMGAGVFIGLVSFHVIPEAFEVMGLRGTGISIIAGFLLVFILERYTMVHVCAELDCRVHFFGRIAFAGICVHSVLDGLALGAVILLKRVEGPMFFAILVHKIPVTVSLVLLFLKSGMDKKKIIRWGFLFALSTPLGIMLTLLNPIVSHAYILSLLMTFSSGTFLYMAGAHLLSETHEHADRPFPMILSLLIGVGLMFII